jgi:TetR/AcrR family transcriptional regulator, transcriptional repressor for nem operon
MRQPLQTKQTILQQAGVLFNSKGYKATSVSDITTATGLTKGALYRHFENKDALEAAALQHLFNSMLDHFRKRVKAETNAIDKLKAVMDFFGDYISKPPIKGGCPLLNVAIEADDSNNRLRKNAAGMLALLKTSIETILENGIRFQQIQTNCQPATVATIMIASLEGAVMMSKLQKNDGDLKTVIQYLKNMIDGLKLLTAAGKAAQQRKSTSVRRKQSSVMG